MTRHRRQPLAVALLACLAWGCDRDGATKSPGGAGSDPGSRLEGREPGLAGDPEAEQKQALPTVRDRDPEEEKKKMALSRRLSAEARRTLQKGSLDSAIEQARQALRAHEQNVDAMLVVAEAFYRQGKYGLTQAVASSALAVDPKIRSPQETSRAHNLMGFALIALGKEAQATNAFRKAAEADEKNAAAWNNLGTRYLDAGDVDTALSCFEYALELAPNSAKAHVNHGAALRAKKRWQDAERALLQGLRLRSNYAEAYFNLGVLYLDADPFPGLDTNKRLNKAIANLTKYRELAIADARGPASGSLASSTSGRGPASLGPAVSRERADDYIRVAKKGIEREQRRLEREKERQGKPSGTPAKDATGGGSTTTKPEATKPEATKPEATQPEATKPEATKPEATRPEAPPPGQPSQPSKPKPAPDEPADPPSAPSSPGGDAPAPQKPTVQKPGGSG
jgi:tetratricopeptide (TPR) repeat protein